MAYTITKSDGTVLTTIADGTRDTTTSLSLAGPNFVGYGQYLDQNLVYLLENFASNNPPSATNLQGQLWFDKYNQTLKVYTELGYVSVSGVTNSSSQPLQAKNGDIWFNNTTEQMYIYDTSNTSGFKLVGPTYTKQQGVSGVMPLTVEDAAISGTFHNIMKVQFGNLTYATFSADPSFTPNPPIPGFVDIHPGITFSSNVANPTFNANVIGSVIGDVIGNLTGNVVATTLSGHLTGSVTGNLTGDVVATSLTGHLFGDVTAVTTYTDNFSSSNVRVSGGYITNLANISASTATFTNLTSTNASIDNISSTNATIAGGSATGLTTLSATNGSIVNLVSANATVTGGNATGLTNISSTNGSIANFTTNNLSATGGSATGLTNLTATTGQIANLTSNNLVVTGGNITGVATVGASIGQFNAISTQNAQITGGNVSGVSGVGVTFAGATLNNSVATTKNLSDKSTAIATTAFVHTIMPTGMIVMWNSTAASIPAGWQLCDGSNGTPNLRGQFIVGAGGAYSVGDQGGATSVTLDATQMPIHTHGLSGSYTTTAAGAHSHSVSDPGHNHVIGIQGGNGSVNAANSLVGDPSQDTGRRTGSSATGITIGSAPDHTHSVSLTGSTLSAGGSSGVTQAHENRPPYYALCYIQKMY